MGKQSPADARVQQQLGLPDRYEVLRHVASGGMASVWCATDQALGRNVAIKLLAERFTTEEAANDRFMREARAAARLSGHPHVVMIYDVGETAGPFEVGGRAFIVMEYLAGGTVADALRVDSVRRVEAVKWLHEAASALDYGHSRGVLHRDIKPANMLLDRDRVLHVADFGIARLGTEDTITSTGQVLGTAAYLAPERALGRPATGASDRYSLAVAAFELLVGERPFTSRHFAAQARQHVEDQPPAASNRNRSLPREVDAVLARGMAKRPEERPSSAQEFAQAIEDALTGAATKTLRVTPAAPPRRPRSRRAGAGAAADATAEPTTSRRTAPRTAAIPARTASNQPRTGSVPPRTASPPPRTGSLPAQSGSRPRGFGRRLPALAALLAGAGVAVAVAGTLGSGGSTPARSAAGAQRPSTVASAPKRPAASTTTHAAPPPAATTTSTTTATTTGPPTANQLEAQGHQLMDDGSYSAAVPVLRQAVEAAGPGTLTYAYALYDLGRSLRLAGDPRDAVPVLWQRMQIHDQTGAVRQQLQLALIALGQASKHSGGAGSSPSGQTQHGPRAAAPRAGPGPAAPGQDDNDQGD